MTTDCNDRCTACGAHLDLHGHFDGCGNAYEGETTVERPRSGYVLACPLDDDEPRTLGGFLAQCALDCVAGGSR